MVSHGAVFLQRSLLRIRSMDYGYADSYWCDTGDYFSRESPAIVATSSPPVGDGPAFVGMGLYHAARLLHSCEKKNAFRVNSLFDMNIVQIFVAGLIITALIFANGAINLRAGTYAFIPLFWINAIGASLIGWSIARKIDSCEKGILSIPARWLRRVGKDSLVYLCWNQLAILIVAKIMIHIVGDSVSVPVLHTMILILTMLFLWEMDSLLQNTRLRILLGK